MNHIATLNVNSNQSHESAEGHVMNQKESVEYLTASTKDPNQKKLSDQELNKSTA